MWSQRVKLVVITRKAAGSIPVDPATIGNFNNILYYKNLQLMMVFMDIEVRPSGLIVLSLKLYNNFNYTRKQCGPINSIRINVVTAQDTVSRSKGRGLTLFILHKHTLQICHSSYYQLLITF